jgi:hypothetical protein
LFDSCSSCRRFLCIALAAEAAADKLAPSLLQCQLEQLKEQLATAASADEGNDSDTSPGQHAELERARALALRSCANLACTRLEPGGEEAAWLASKRCGGCRLVRYCGAACCKADWRAHRGVCKLWTALATAE